MRLLERGPEGIMLEQCWGTGCVFDIAYPHTRLNSRCREIIASFADDRNIKAAWRSLAFQCDGQCKLQAMAGDPVVSDSISV